MIKYSLLLLAVVSLFAQTKIDAPTQIKRLPYLDVRTYGATPITGSCTTSTVDNSAAIQSAIMAAQLSGQDVYLAPGYCWPIGYHIWVPSGVHFYGAAGTTGYGVSSPGTLLIANANWATNNPTFPYSQMVWQTGQNQTSGTYIVGASGNTTVNLNSEVDHMEIDCNDQVGCGNFFSIGRKTQAFAHDLKLSGGVPFGSGGYSFGFYDQGNGCNNQVAPANGCLVPVFTTGLNSSGQGPDYNIQIYPSPNAPSVNFISFFMVGGSDYLGLQSSLVSCAPGGLYGAVFQGFNSFIGPNIQNSGCVDAVSIGVSPFTNLQASYEDTFLGVNGQVLIGDISGNAKLSFIGITGGISNQMPNAPTVSVSGPDYYYDASNVGPLGLNNGYYSQSSILISDPGNIAQSGWQPISASTPPAAGFTSSFSIGPAVDAATNYTSAYACGNAYYNHSAGNWLIPGITTYGCMLNLNSGSIAFSNGAASPIGGAITNAVLLSNIGVTISPLQHLLVGDYVNTSTGVVTDITGSNLGWNGGATGDFLVLSGSLASVDAFVNGYVRMYNASIASNFLFPVFTSGTTEAYNYNNQGDSDFLNEHGSATGGYYFYSSNSGSSVGSLLATLNSSALYLGVPLTITGAGITQSGGNVSLNGPLTGLTQAAESTTTTCPTSTSAGSTCTFTVTWSSSFYNTSYHVMGCVLIAPTGSPTIQGVTTKNSNNIIVTIANGQGSQAVASGAGAIDCSATPWP